MDPEAVIATLADELRQQQGLRYALRHPVLPPEECARRLAEEQVRSVGAIVTLEPEDVPRRCYAVYQGCAYEAVARGESFPLTPGQPLELTLAPQPEQDCFQLLLGGDLAQLAEKAELFWRDVEQRAPRPLVSSSEPGVIHLDPAVEGQLTDALHAGNFLARWYANGQPEVGGKLAEDAARHCYFDIGCVLLAALCTRLYVRAEFLGSMHWPGGDTREVRLKPSRRLLEHLDICKLRQRRVQRRQTIQAGKAE